MDASAGPGAAGARPGWRRLFGKTARENRTPAQMRRRIAIWAIVIGFLAGFFDVPRPLEDGYRMLRAVARPHKVDGRTAIVVIDDRSLSELGVRDPLRGDDARLIDGLLAAGAKRVVFDRAFADPSSRAEDAKLVAAMERHRGRVFVGSTPELDFGFSKGEQIITHPRFRGHAQMVSMVGYQGPFDLSFRMPTSSNILGRNRQSISALLADVDAVDRFYHPDFSIKPDDIPMFSYVDVLKGRVPAEEFAMRDVIIAPGNLAAPDRYKIPFVGAVLGSQIHAIGAQTLRERFPLDLGFLPAFALSALFVWAQSLRRRPSRSLAVIAAAGLLALPALFDFASLNLNVFPALICLAIGTIRLINLSRKAYRDGTELLRIGQLHSSHHASSCDVLALKIRNFATISAILTPKEIDTLLERLRDRLRAAEGNVQFAFEKDTIVWLRNQIPAFDREGHLRGLHALFRTSIAIGSQAPDVAVALGLDANYDLALRKRIEGAIQAAEDAAHNGHLFLVGEKEGENRAWQLSFFTELAAAIDSGDLDVLFQPKVHLSSGMIVGAEALLRWTHPTRGQIDPAQIVQYAEEHNRIDTITRFVLERALTEARTALQRDPLFKVAVNISALDLRDPAFVEEVARYLKKHDFPAGNLILEITETAPIESDALASSLLNDLKKLGVRLSVDDFGTGHASLHYLRQIPSHEVKIDRSFVSGMVDSAEDRTLVRTAVEMIHSLGRVAVAEGVETEAVAKLLIEIGCDKAQGYFFSRAVPMEQLLPKLAKRVLAA